MTSPTDPILAPDQVTEAWLSEVLRQTVVELQTTHGESNFARSVAIQARFEDGSERRLWLKMFVGNTFGRSEVDFYTRDYVGVPNLPLVHCHHAAFAEGKGYHVLLDDLSATYEDRKHIPPTLAHGLALADAIAALHRVHWESEPAAVSALDAYYDHIRPGLEGIERATGRAYRRDFEAHEERLRDRYRDPKGQTLLHGDINPTNVLTPRGAEGPAIILDRQPFDWSIRYGLAVSDLTYAMVPWWPKAFVDEHGLSILRRWHEGLQVTSYPWEKAQEDWELSREQCLHVPIEWCANPEDVERMRGLWSWQLTNMGISF